MRLRIHYCQICCRPAGLFYCDALDMDLCEDCIAYLAANAYDSVAEDT